MTPSTGGDALSIRDAPPPGPSWVAMPQALRHPDAFGGISALVAVWIVFQNFWRFSTPSLSFDEPFYSIAGWRYLHGMTQPSASVVILGGITQSNWDNFEHPPLAKLMFGVAQLVAGHPSVTADRLVASTCTVATAALLGWWIARAAGRWTGLLAAGLAGLLNMSAITQTVRFGRDGVLDPVAGMFALLSVVLLWEWLRSESPRRAWIFAAWSGVAIGAATASKENGFLMAVGPLVVGITINKGAAAVHAAQAAAAVGIAVVVLVATYLPVGAPFNHIDYMYRFASAHNRLGHLVGYAGRVSLHQPWWTNFWFAAHYLGPAVSWALVVTSAVAVAVRRDRLVGWCLAAFAGPVIFHCFVSSVSLPYYWVMWMPPVIALAALGAHELVTLARRHGGPTVRWLAVAVLVAASASWVVSATGQTETVATLRPEGPAAVPGVRENHGLTGQILAVGFSNVLLSPYVSQVYYAPPKSFARVDTVVVSQPRCLAHPARELVALVAENLAAGRLKLIHTDREARVYEVLQELTYPSAGEVAAAAVPDYVDNC